ncbi:hypothetical protein LJ737_23080 [Hymenobacter sp. 15J16-1T3B]|uniref:hypothetical protein n=1 Tax=Hymenobacter sp. 15J16-1T3B TaxID=2886941 RepID=UPI001D10CA24|nr:hypothetical protein [Hymenobacter sp. 15J16-1T3B]MCC3160138.1 hypothetical protein [Hymenobacter sp. 15J16-1T3B]
MLAVFNVRGISKDPNAGSGHNAIFSLSYCFLIKANAKISNKKRAEVAYSFLINTSDGLAATERIIAAAGAVGAAIIGFVVHDNRVIKVR